MEATIEDFKRDIERYRTLTIQQRINEKGVHTLKMMEKYEHLIICNSSLQLKHKQEIDFERWIRDNNYEKITELNYKKGRRVFNINKLRRLYNTDNLNL